VPARSLLRARNPHGGNKVTNLELFFDLVFVFAITQLSHRLLEHFSLGGALRTGLLTLAVWWVWVYTSWSTNWLDPDRLPVRLMLLAAMLASLVMSAAIPQAFEGGGMAFGASYAAIQVGRTAFVVWCMRGHAVQVRNFRRILVWLAAAGILWLIGGAVSGHARFGFWLAALAVEYAGPLAYFWVPGLGRSATADWDIDGHHMAERCGLFIIIALGESIVVTGATFAALAPTAVTVAAFCCAFFASAAMWWIYFDQAAEAAASIIGRSGDPGRLARSAYTYSHALLVVGIIVTAVAAEKLLDHPLGHTSSGTIAVMVGGPVLFMLGNILFCWTMAREYAPGIVCATAALALLAPAGVFLSPLGLGAAVTAVLVGVAAWEGWN
jgi:low temperature requirement protein LtrA